MDGIESAYRLLVADAMPFGKNARIQLEHGGLDDAVEHYRTVVYSYGAPSACLVHSDTLHVGDAADELQHAYDSPSASAPISITSRWDGLGGDAEDHPAGTWYLAGSTSVVHSNPQGELDAAAPTVETIDRCFRDDELVLPRTLTEGRSH